MDKLAAFLKSLLHDKMNVNTMTKLVAIKVIEEFGCDVHTGLIARRMDSTCANSTIKKSLDLLAKGGILIKSIGKAKANDQIRTAHFYELTPIAKEIAEHVYCSIEDLMEIRKISTSIHQALVTHCLYVNGEMTRPEITEWTKTPTKDTARLSAIAGRLNVNRISTHKSIYSLTEKGEKYAELIRKIGEGVLV